MDGFLYFFKKHPIKKPSKSPYSEEVLSMTEEQKKQIIRLRKKGCGLRQSRDFKRYGQEFLQEERAGRGNGGGSGDWCSGMPGMREAPAADGGDEAPRVLLR